jgi:hypothetical protein
MLFLLDVEEFKIKSFEDKSSQRFQHMNLDKIDRKISKEMQDVEC